MKSRNKIVQEITQNVANVSSFYAVIAIEHGFSIHQHSPGPLGGVENSGLWPPYIIWIQHDCLANTIFALDPSNNVTKRLWNSKKRYDWRHWS